MSSCCCFDGATVAFEACEACKAVSDRIRCWSILTVVLVATVREAASVIPINISSGFTLLLSLLFANTVQGYQLENAGREANQARTNPLGPGHGVRLHLVLRVVCVALAREIAAGVVILGSTVLAGLARSLFDASWMLVNEHIWWLGVN